MQTRLALCAAISALFAAGIPGTANAQTQSRSEGFFVGAAYEHNDGDGAIKPETGAGTDSSPGFGVTAGYGFSRTLSLYGQFSTARVDGGSIGDYDVRHIDIGTRVHFLAPAKSLVPFLQAGISLRDVQQGLSFFEVESRDLGVAVGGGINAHFHPALAMTAGPVWSLGNMGIKVNGIEDDDLDFRMTTVRLHIGVVWFPQKK